MGDIRTPLSSASSTEGLIDRVFRALADHIGSSEPTAVRTPGGFSNNELVEIHLDDGRSLVVKQARFEWAAEQFDTARTVASLLRNEDVVTPNPIYVSHEAGDRPLMAYWYVPLPTLREVWPEATWERADLVRSWGALMRRVHEIELPGHGSIAGPGSRTETLTAFLDADLHYRLRPAIAEVWPEGLKIVDCLLAAVPRLCGDDDERRRATLLHNDLHMGNVLCRHDPDGPRCVGFLDLESATAGPPESDLANAAVQHTPLFGQQAHEAGFYDLLSEGYGRNIDPRLLTFFEVYHLANMGFYSALIGCHDHAGQLASVGRDSAERALKALAGAGKTTLLASSLQA